MLLVILYDAICNETPYNMYNISEIGYVIYDNHIQLNTV